MTNEIKEILKNLKEHTWLEYKEMDILLDYITNLQEENERLKNELDKVKSSYETEAEAKYYEYIDNHESKLQEENEKLKKKDKTRNAFKEFVTNEYKLRINKALKCIKDYEEIVGISVGITANLVFNLKYILQGEDK